MDKKQKEISRTLQILLWLWFGLITSFSATNVVNIAKLETEVNELNTSVKQFQTALIQTRYYSKRK